MGREGSTLRTHAHFIPLGKSKGRRFSCSEDVRQYKEQGGSVCVNWIRAKDGPATQYVLRLDLYHSPSHSLLTYTHIHDDEGHALSQKLRNDATTHSYSPMSPYFFYPIQVSQSRQHPWARTKHSGVGFTLFPSVTSA